MVDLHRWSNSIVSFSIQTFMELKKKTLLRQITLFIHFGGSAREIDSNHNSPTTLVDISRYPNLPKNNDLVSYVI